jgi:hypothetical protein
VTADRVRVTEIDVGATVAVNEDEAALKPLAIAALSSGGSGTDVSRLASRLAFMGNDAKVHVAALDAADHVSGTPVAFAAADYSDLYADDAGGVLLLTRDAMGGGNLNCGTLTNLCGTTLPASDACFDMYMVRFDGAAETWATKLTTSSAALPPYSTGPTGANVLFIWWYAHHGRIAFDGSRYAGYYGVAISTSQSCVTPSNLATAINIHQGDSMQIVDRSGALQSGGFGIGCSHSGYERIVWDPAGGGKLVTVCKTDNNNRISFAPRYVTIRAVDLAYSNLGNIVLAPGGGYWLTSSDIRAGQPAGAAGLADVHLLHFTTGAADQDIVVASDAGLNDRAPHLAAYGTGALLAAWETSTVTGDLAPNDKARKLYVQTRDAASGAAVGGAVQVPGVVGNRYQDFRSFPDGSVAYAAPGSASTKVKIVRVLPCAP